MQLASLTAIVGAGGTGKSSFLHAIDWFFNGNDLDDRDVGLMERPVSVTVTLSELDALDRGALGRWATGDQIVLRRQRAPSGAISFEGQSPVYKDFDAIRSLTKAVDRRKAAREYIEAHGATIGLSLPPSNTAEAFDRALSEWETCNPERCEERWVDASELLQVPQTGGIGGRIDFVLIGISDSAEQTLQPSRGSALSVLLDSATSRDASIEDRVAAIQQRAVKEIQELVGGAREDGLEAAAAAITARVQEYVAEASVRLRTVVEPGRPPAAGVEVEIVDPGGHATDASRHGHGLQRAVVIGTLHEMADWRRKRRGIDSTGLPRLILAIEEPELYQHPLQARALAEAMRALAEATPGDDHSVQVLYTTHSPHFTRPALVEGVRLFRRSRGRPTSSSAIDLTRVSSKLLEIGIDDNDDVGAHRILSTALAEAVFARGVVICEGPSDAAFVGAVGRLYGGFDRDGIAVISTGGKSFMPLTGTLLADLDIPTFAVFDADGNIRARMEAKGRSEQDVDATESNTAAMNTRLLGLFDTTSEEWPARGVRDRCAIFADELEVDVHDMWPDLKAIKDTVVKDSGMKPKAPELYDIAVPQTDPGQRPEFVKDLVDAVRRAVESWGGHI